MGLGEADAGPTSGTSMTTLREAHRHRHCGSASRQLSFGCYAPGRYVQLLSSEMEVVNTFQTKTYQLNDEEKVPTIENWLHREGLQLIQTIQILKKRQEKSVEGLFTTLGKS